MKYLTFTTTALSAMLLMTGISASATSGATDDQNYGTTGDVEFYPSTDVEQPVHPSNPDPNKPVVPINPIDPEQPVKPGTSGPLSIDYVSDFQFGQQFITTEDATYLAQPQTFAGDLEPTANYVQVTDKRGTAEGWSLSVKQMNNFTANTADAANKELIGLELKIDAQAGEQNSMTETAGKPTGRTVVLNGEGSTGDILSAKRLEGTGTWTSTFGQLVEKTVSKLNEDNEQVEELQTLNQGVELMIPGAVQTDATSYSMTLNWVLEQKPGM